MAKKEWEVTVRKDGGAVRVYHWGKPVEVLKPGKETYEAPAGAIKFAEELYGELKKQSATKKADHDVQTEPNLKNDATGAGVTGKPSPTVSSDESKVAKLQGELRKTKAQLSKERRRHALEIKARRGAKLAEVLVKRGALEEQEETVKAFVKDVAMMSDDEIGRLERKAAGDAEFTSVEEAERAERTYKREARILLRKADEAHESGDADAADKFDASATDAMKNAECCRAFIRQAAHDTTAAEKGNCADCGKPNFLCNGKCSGDAADDDKEAATDAETEEKEAATDAAEGEKEAATDAEGEEKEAATDAEGEEKTADHDVQEEPNLKNDAKGVAVTGKPSPSTNTKAADEETKKEASEEADPLVALRQQHIATAKMYRNMADEAEERGDFVDADTFDHKAQVCEDLAKDAAVETASPEPELAGVTDEAPENMEREASEEASTEDTDGPSEGAAKTASAGDEGEIDLTDELIEAAVTPKEVQALRSAYSGQRRHEPSRVDPSASGVMRIANVDENAASNDDDVVALEGLWTGAPRE